MIGTTGLLPVFPPFSGGLHCGPLAAAYALRSGPCVFPPVTGGTHCGIYLREKKVLERTSALPPVRAGSIAARRL